MTLKALKCVFAAQKIEVFGFELSVDGIKTLKRLANAINELPHPWSKKELQRFLCMTENDSKDETCFQPICSFTCIVNCQSKHTKNYRK